MAKIVAINNEMDHHESGTVSFFLTLENLQRTKTVQTVIPRNNVHLISPLGLKKTM